ncbi:hypothetical protein GJ496_008847 [Pomphorhynchus laevis]|nr:hypothetical protein GJ496_008847 [Pomphorhynchus laevis]
MSTSTRMGGWIKLLQNIRSQSGESNQFINNNDHLSNRDQTSILPFIHQQQSCSCSNSPTNSTDSGAVSHDPNSPSFLDSNFQCDENIDNLRSIAIVEPTIGGNHEVLCDYPWLTVDNSLSSLVNIQNTDNMLVQVPHASSTDNKLPNAMSIVDIPFSVDQSESSVPSPVAINVDDMISPNKSILSESHCNLQDMCPQTTEFSLDGHSKKDNNLSYQNIDVNDGVHQEASSIITSFNPPASSLNSTHPLLLPKSITTDSNIMINDKPIEDISIIDAHPINDEGIDELLATVLFEKTHSEFANILNENNAIDHSKTPDIVDDSRFDLQNKAVVSFEINEHQQYCALCEMNSSNRSSNKIDKSYDKNEYNSLHSNDAIVNRKTFCTVCNLLTAIRKYDKIETGEYTKSSVAIKDNSATINSIVSNNDDDSELNKLSNLLSDSLLLLDRGSLDKVNKDNKRRYSTIASLIDPLPSTIGFTKLTKSLDELFVNVLKTLKEECSEIKTHSLSTEMNDNHANHFNKMNNDKGSSRSFVYPTNVDSNRLRRLGKSAFSELDQHSTSIMYTHQFADKPLFSYHNQIFPPRNDKSPFMKFAFKQVAKTNVKKAELPVKRSENNYKLTKNLCRSSPTQSFKLDLVKNRRLVDANCRKSDHLPNDATIIKTEVLCDSDDLNKTNNIISSLRSRTRINSKCPSFHNQTIQRPTRGRKKKSGRGRKPRIKEYKDDDNDGYDFGRTGIVEPDIKSFRDVFSGNHGDVFDDRLKQPHIEHNQKANKIVNSSNYLDPDVNSYCAEYLDDINSAQSPTISSKVNSLIDEDSAGLITTTNDSSSLVTSSLSDSKHTQHHGSRPPERIQIPVSRRGRRKIRKDDSATDGITTYTGISSVQNQSFSSQDQSLNYTSFLKSSSTTLCNKAVLSTATEAVEEKTDLAAFMVYADDESSVSKIEKVLTRISPDDQGKKNTPSGVNTSIMNAKTHDRIILPSNTYVHISCAKAKAILSSQIRDGSSFPRNLNHSPSKSPSTSEASTSSFNTSNLLSKSFEATVVANEQSNQQSLSQANKFDIKEDLRSFYIRMSSFSVLKLIKSFAIRGCSYKLPNYSDCTATATTNNIPSINSTAKAQTFVFPNFPAECLTPCSASGFQIPYFIVNEFLHDVYKSIKHSTLFYHRISKNVYVDVDPPRSQSIKCECSPFDNLSCGASCLNRLMLTECSRSCPCENKCSNRAIQQNEFFPHLAVFDTCTPRGFGVRSLKAIPADVMVAEYLGEVVNEQEFRQRMNEIYANERHHFTMTLGDSLVIDSYRFGGIARFINHSCQPNCEVRQWIVDGLRRMCLFTVRAIDENEELTYNYNFRAFSRTALQNCFCGCKNCTGKIGIPMESSDTSKHEFRIRPRSYVRKSAKIQEMLDKSLWISAEEANFIRIKKLFLFRNLRQCTRRTGFTFTKRLLWNPHEESSRFDVVNMNYINKYYPDVVKSAMDNPIYKLKGKLSDLNKLILAIVDDMCSFVYHGINICTPFNNCPDKDVIPMYYDLVSKPIDLCKIREKARQYAYISFSDFEDDLNLLFDNVIKYTGTQHEVIGALTTIRILFRHLCHQAKYLIARIGTGVKRTIMTSSKRLAPASVDVNVFSDICVLVEYIVIVTAMQMDDKAEVKTGIPCELNTYFQYNRRTPRRVEVLDCACNRVFDDIPSIQCMLCKRWQHKECLTQNIGKVYICEKCVHYYTGRRLPTKIPRLNLDGSCNDNDENQYIYIRYGKFQVRQGCHYYINTDNISDIISQNDHGNTSNSVLSLSRKNFGIRDLRRCACTARIDKIWFNHSGKPLVQANIYIRPDHTFHEPNRRFFRNELFKSPLCRTLTLDSVGPECHILDLHTFLKGKPRSTSEADLYVCEHRMDKTHHVFSRISKNKYLHTNTMPYCFEPYIGDFRPKRTYVPHKEEAKQTSTKNNLSIEVCRKFTRLSAELDRIALWRNKDRFGIGRFNQILNSSSYRLYTIQPFEFCLHHYRHLSRLASDNGANLELNNPSPNMNKNSANTHHSRKTKYNNTTIVSAKSTITKGFPIESSNSVVQAPCGGNDKNVGDFGFTASKDTDSDNNNINGEVTKLIDHCLLDNKLYNRGIKLNETTDLVNSAVPSPSHVEAVLIGKRSLKRNKSKQSTSSTMMTNRKKSGRSNGVRKKAFKSPPKKKSTPINRIDLINYHLLGLHQFHKLNITLLDTPTSTASSTDLQRKAAYIVPGVATVERLTKKTDEHKRTHSENNRTTSTTGDMRPNNLFKQVVCSFKDGLSEFDENGILARKLSKKIFVVGGTSSHYVDPNVAAFTGNQLSSGSDVTTKCLLIDRKSTSSVFANNSLCSIVDDTLNHLIEEVVLHAPDL